VTHGLELAEQTIYPIPNWLRLIHREGRYTGMARVQRCLSPALGRGDKAKLRAAQLVRTSAQEPTLRTGPLYLTTSFAKRCDVKFEVTALR
jgi:hypothetical protein